jgi:hypothetical protein
MDVTITNTGTAAYFLPGPDISLAPGESKVVSDVNLNDIDENVVLKGYVQAGVATVSIADDVTDAATPTQGSFAAAGLQKYAFARLPTGYEGRVAFCTNGRRTGQGPGAGTGVPVYWSAAAWRVFFDDTAVAI